MRIAVIGGGPGGLDFAYLWKRRYSGAEIDLYEQNAAGATWGFGVVFSEQALEFLRADDPETVDAITPRMESWKNITLHLRGESVAIDGVGFSSIGRLELLKILQQRVRDAGVTPRYDTLVQSLDELNGYDLIIAADEPSIVEAKSGLEQFGTKVEAVQADLSTIDGVDQLLAIIGERPVDALKANAGRGICHGFLDQEWVDMRRVVDTNVTETH